MFDMFRWLVCTPAAMTMLMVKTSLVSSPAALKIPLVSAPGSHVSLNELVSAPAFHDAHIT